MNPGYWCLIGVSRCASGLDPAPRLRGAGGTVLAAPANEVGLRYAE